LFDLDELMNMEVNTSDEIDLSQEKSFTEAQALVGDTIKTSTQESNADNVVVKMNEFATLEYPANGEIVFKKSTKKIKDIIDMSLPELLSQYVYTTDEGVPYLVKTDKEGNIIPEVKEPMIVKPKHEMGIAEPVEENPEEKVKEAIKTRPAYYYTASYHNSRLGDKLRIMEIIDLPIDELKKLEVIIGGQSFVNLLAPSANTVIIKEEDINSLGLNTIEEVLQCLASIDLYKNDYAATGGFRGLSNDLSDLLILINGREFNSLYSNESMLSAQFGTSNIKQLEITFGPGEIDYHYTAYAGVINIVTKDFKEGEHNAEIQATATSANHKEISMAFGKKVDKFQINGNARFVKSNLSHEDIDRFLRDTSRYAPSAPMQANGIFNQNNFYRNTKEAATYNMHANFKDFYFGSNYYLNKVGNKGMRDLVLNYNNANEEKRNLLKGYIGYDYIFNSNSNLNMEYSYTHETIEGANRNFMVDQATFNMKADSVISNTEVYEYFTEYYSQSGSNGSQKHVAKASLYNIFNVKTKNKFFKGDFAMSLGYQFDYNDILGLNPSNQLPVPDFNDNKQATNPLRHPFYSYYTQQAYLLLRKSLINEKVFFSVGAKYKHHQYYKGDFLVRSRASIKLANKTYVKFGFSQGITDPYVSQLQMVNQLNNWAFNYNLKPSKISVSNAGFVTAFGEFLTINGNFYYNIYENYLIKNMNFWENATDTRYAYGVESKVTAKYDGFTLNVDYTFQQQPDNELNFSKHKAVIIANYDAHEYVGINVAISYASKLKTFSPFNNQVVELPKRLGVDLNLSSREVKVGKTTFTLVGSIKNLADSKVYYPNVEQFGTTMFIGNGRYFAGRLIVKL